MSRQLPGYAPLLEVLCRALCGCSRLKPACLHTLTDDTDTAEGAEGGAVAHVVARAASRNTERGPLASASS